MLWAALDGRVNGALEAPPSVGVLVFGLGRVFRSSRHMGPQPLSRVRRNASTTFDPDIHLAHRELASYPMTVISRWARTDGALAELLSALLKSTDVVVGVAMYQALTSGDARHSALLAAAREALTDDDYWLLDAVLRVIKPSRDRRNEFAHHLWGFSKDVPDALLLVDPKVFIRHLTIRAAHSRGVLAMYTRTVMRGKPWDDGRLDHSKVYVFRKPDLVQEVKAAQEAATYAFLLNVAVDRGRYGAKADEMRQRLLTVPAIRQAFEALSLGNRKATPPRRRPKRLSAKQRRTQALQKKK